MPGFGELMREMSLAVAPTAILSRQTAGIRGNTLLLNLPGDPSTIDDCLCAVLPATSSGSCEPVSGTAPTAVSELPASSRVRSIPPLRWNHQKMSRPSSRGGSRLGARRSCPPRASGRDRKSDRTRTPVATHRAAASPACPRPITVTAAVTEPVIVHPCGRVPRRPIDHPPPSHAMNAGPRVPPPSQVRRGARAIRRRFGRCFVRSPSHA